MEKNVMAKMTKTDLENLIDEHKIQKLGLEARYENVDDPVKKSEIEGKIAVVNDKIEQYEISLLKLTKATDSALDARNWEESKEVVKELIGDFHMGYLPKTSKYWYCEDAGFGDYTNPQIGEITTQPKPIIDFLRMKKAEKYGNKDIQGITEERIRDLFLDLGKTYTATVSSFNDRKWSPKKYLNQMKVIESYWVKPVKGEVDQRLDFLIHCVCGGKEENIEHLKKWIVIKHKRPDLSANIPNIDIGGGKGGSGKGALITLLKTIFTTKCVVPADASELIKFNGGWGMATIAYFDEGDSAAIDANALKRSTGAEERREEKKGVEATVVDSCENKVFTSNNPKGVVPLVGGEGGEDRRYSIIYTGTSMIPEAMRLYGFTKEDAELYVHSMWNDVIKNREKISHWLYSLYEEYGDIDSLSALHGEDYHARFDKQKDDITKAFDEITPLVIEQGVIATEWLWKLVQNLTENGSWKQKNVKERYEEYLKRQGISAEVKSNTRISISDDDTVTLQAFRLTDEYEKKPYAFDWNRVCVTDYVRYAKDKTQWELTLRDASDNVLQFIPQKTN